MGCPHYANPYAALLARHCKPYSAKNSSPMLHIWGGTYRTATTFGWALVPSWELSVQQQLEHVPTQLILKGTWFPCAKITPWGKQSPVRDDVQEILFRRSLLSWNRILVQIQCHIALFWNQNRKALQVSEPLLMLAIFTRGIKTP